MAPHTGGSSDEIRNRLQELLNKLRVRATTPRVDFDGDLEVDPGTGRAVSPVRGPGTRTPTTGRQKPDDLTVVPSGAQMAKMAHNMERAPKLIPLDDPAEIEDKQIVARAGRYYPKTGELFINMTYPAVDQMHEQLTREYAQAPDPEVMQRMAWERPLNPRA